MNKTMRKPRYEMIETVKGAGTEDAYCCYGIRMIDADGDTISIEDLSLEQNRLEKLVRLCNKLQLSPLHFWDVANDFVNDN